MIRHRLFPLLLLLSCAGCGDDLAAASQAVPSGGRDMGGGSDQAQEMGLPGADATGGVLDIPRTKEEAARRSVLEGERWQGLDICVYRRWYGDGVCDWFCPRWDGDCAPEPVFPAAPTHAPIYPVLLLHGFSGGTSGVWSFWHVVETLEQDGVKVAATRVAPYDTVPNRGGELATEIDRYLELWQTKRVNLIAHSMGGLDARHVISALGYDDRIESLTTISTPHRGTIVSDVVLGLLPGFTEGLITSLATLLGRVIHDMSDRADLIGALGEFSQPNIAAFNQAHPDKEAVRYYSWAGVSHAFGIYGAEYGAWRACEGKIFGSPNHVDRTTPLLLAPALLMLGLPSDGLVPVESAKWGEFQGCIPADHIDELGQIQRSGPDLRTGFDHLEFYRKVVRDLVERGH